MRRKETVVYAYVAVVSRLAALSSVVAGLAVSGCADFFYSPEKQVSRSAKVTATRSAPMAASRVAAARPLPKPPQPAPPPPVDTLFDSRRVEGVGTLALAEIMPLVRQNPRLRDEVDTALRESGAAADTTTCIGKRVGNWRYLAGARVQPYTCKIGARWLEITADVRVSGPGGEYYSTVSDIAAQNATRINESNPRWTWTDAKPSNWPLE
jgi:hypothetical protein